MLGAGDHMAYGACTLTAFLVRLSVCFRPPLAGLGIGSTFVDLTDLNAWEKAIRPNTKLFFPETPSIL